MMFRARREAKLRSEGIDGAAKLKKWWIVGKSGGEIESIELIEYELEVHVAGNPPYQIKHRQLTPFGIFSRLWEGMEIPLKVHPEKPKQVLLIWEEAGPVVQVVQSPDLPDEVIEAIKGIGAASFKGTLKSRLRELEDALQENLITKEEYERKREELLTNL